MRSTFSKSVLLIVLLVMTTQVFAQHNPGLMFLQSLAVPGMGELWQGNNSGYVFIASEILLWSSMFYFQEESHLSKRHAYETALEYAHVTPRDYSDEYYHHLSKYDSSGYEAGGYNEGIRRTAINLYPGDAEAQALYIQNNAYSDDYSWNWDSDERKNQYTKHYKDIQTNKDYAQAMIGGIVLNHLVSGFNSLFYARKTNRRIEMGVHMDHDMTPVLSASWKF